MGPHFIYWWHVRSHNQVKIGYGRDPHDRMFKCAERYGFEADSTSLRYREMRSERAAKLAEAKLHQLLAEYDLIPLDWEARDGQGDSRELFVMRDSTYESVDWLVAELLAQIVATMATDAELVAAEMAEYSARKVARPRREAASEAWEIEDD